ncbi:MAG: DUF2147 domain-containing protein [Sphaerochaetaceae bacterium]|jgi:uncharacterized protein (DUF2147 family)
MKKVLVLLTAFVFFSFKAHASTEVVGLWKSVDARKGFTTSVMVVYEYQQRLYGRVIISYDEKTGALVDSWQEPSLRIERLAHKPLVVQHDLFWGLSLDNQKWVGGTIIDPRSGRTYGCDVWIEDNLLVIRGKLGPFGMRQIFYPLQPYELPVEIGAPVFQNIIPSSPVR